MIFARFCGRMFRANRFMLILAQVIPHGHPRLILRFSCKGSLPMVY